MGSLANVQSSQSLSSSSRLRPPEWVLIMGALVTLLGMFALWHAFGTTTSCAADAVFRCVYICPLAAVCQADVGAARSKASPALRNLHSSTYTLYYVRHLGVFFCLASPSTHTSLHCPNPICTAAAACPAAAARPAVAAAGAPAAPYHVPAATLSGLSALSPRPPSAQKLRRCCRSGACPPEDPSDMSLGPL